MHIFYFSPLLILSLTVSYAYDSIEGGAQQGKPCFDVIHSENCHSSLPEVISTERKGMGINCPNTKMYLFTSKNRLKAELLHLCGGKLPRNSDFNPKVDTIVIIHGFVDGVCRTAWMREVKEQLFIRDDYNIILVDWTWGNTFDVAGSGYNAQVVGEQVGQVLIKIMKQTKFNGDKLQVIGHSYGVIGASFCCKTIQKSDIGTNCRILIALDPPVSPFHYSPPSETLSYTDAVFTQCIHSGGGTCLPISLGDITPRCHADFYPNGGSIQPSCFTYIMPSFKKMDYGYVSINHPEGRYVGVRCNNYGEFKSGVCKRCCKDNSTDCAVAGMDAEKYFPHKGQPREIRTYFFDTSNFCPYKEKYAFSIYKDCGKPVCNDDSSYYAKRIH